MTFSHFTSSSYLPSKLLSNFVKSACDMMFEILELEEEEAETRGVDEGSTVEDLVVVVVVVDLVCRRVCQRKINKRTTRVPHLPFMFSRQNSSEEPIAIFVSCSLFDQFN